MIKPIKCPHCPKVLCDHVNGESTVTTSTEPGTGNQLIVKCNWCKKKYSVLIK